MLDRLISGAGAIADAADRLVRALGRGGGESPLGHRPGSVVVAVICAIVAGILVIAGLEATDNPTAVTIAPASVATANDLGSRTYATVAGSLANDYVETFDDTDGDGIQDDGEDALSWFYFLVDPETMSGVAVRSPTSPDDQFVLDAAGVVVEDPTYVAEDVSRFATAAKDEGFTLDPGKYLDATALVSSTTPVHDLAVGLPAADTPIRISGTVADYLPVCSGDANGDGVCADSEVDRWDVAVFDRTSGKAITILVDEDPANTLATITGMLRRDERAVSEATSTVGLDFESLGLDISETYVLEDGSGPASAPLAFGFAALLGLLAGAILIGLAGDYLVYRKATGSLPAPATSLGIGQRVPLRVTGRLRSGGGLVHVREAEADLVRFQTSGPVVPDASGQLATAAPATEIGVPDAVDVGSTLIIERRGQPEGVAVGLGELTRLSRGDVMPLGGRRPALRVTAGTGALLLSFDSETDRDRAAAELLDETGLVAGEKGSAHA